MSDFPPPGFEPVMIWEGTPDNEVVSKTKVKVGEHYFLVAALPVLPLKAIGEIKHMGWDIPTEWAIDSNNDCWMDNAHGGALDKVPATRLLSESKEDGSDVRIRKVLGMKPRMPDWMVAAKNAGWTPPTDWDPTQYE